MALEEDEAQFEAIKLSGARMHFVVSLKNSLERIPYIIGLYIRNKENKEWMRCSFDVMDDFVATTSISCASVDPTSTSRATIDLNIKKIDSFTSSTIFNVIHVEISEKNDLFYLTSLPVSQQPQDTSYLLSLSGKPLNDKQRTRKSYNEDRKSNENFDHRNIASNRFESTLNPIFASIISFFIVIVILVAVILKMVVGSKNSSVTPPKGGNVSPISPSNSPSSLGDANALNGSGLASPGGAFSHSPVSHGLGHSGLISSSIPNNKRGAHINMSPPVGDVPLQTMISSSKHSASPKSSPSAHALETHSTSSNSSGLVSVSTVGGARGSKFGISGDRQARTAPSAASALKNVTITSTTPMSVSSTLQLGIASALGTKKGKIEKVSLVEPLVSPKLRSYAPAVVANVKLASLPAEPHPKPKARYLANSQTNKKIAAKRPVRYHDFVPTPSQLKYGTYSRVFAEKQEVRRRKLSELLDSSEIESSSSQSKAISAEKHPYTALLKMKSTGHDKITAIGGAESILGDEDGPSGLFLDEEDDNWILDVVEPHPDDPIYKNDMQYTHIDVDTLQPVDDSIVDFSLQSIESHLSSIASPLSSPIDHNQNGDAPTHHDGEVKKKKKKSSANSYSPANQDITNPVEVGTNANTVATSAVSSGGTVRRKKKTSTSSLTASSVLIRDALAEEKEEKSSSTYLRSGEDIERIPMSSKTLRPKKRRDKSRDRNSDDSSKVSKSSRRSDTSELESTNDYSVNGGGNSHRALTPSITTTNTGNSSNSSTSANTLQLSTDSGITSASPELASNVDSGSRAPTPSSGASTGWKPSKTTIDTDAKIIVEETKLAEPKPKKSTLRPKKKRSEDAKGDETVEYDELDLEKEKHRRKEKEKSKDKQRDKEKDNS